MRCFEVRVEKKKKSPNESAECLTYIAALEKPQVNIQEFWFPAGVEHADHRFCCGTDAAGLNNDSSH